MPPRSNMSLSGVRKQYIQLNPVNAVSNGVYSPGSGIPLIKFDISSSAAPMFLQGDELRINGKITCAGVTNTGKNFVDNFAVDNCYEELQLNVDVRVLDFLKDKGRLGCEINGPQVSGRIVNFLMVLRRMGFFKKSGLIRCIREWHCGTALHAAGQNFEKICTAFEAKHARRAQLLGSGV